LDRLRNAGLILVLLLQVLALFLAPWRRECLPHDAPPG
jgi:hypothetical protein